MLHSLNDSIQEVCPTSSQDLWLTEACATEKSQCSMPLYPRAGKDEIESTSTILTLNTLLASLSSCMAVCGSSWTPYLQVLLRWSNALIWDMRLPAM